MEDVTIIRSHDQYTKEILSKFCFTRDDIFTRKQVAMSGIVFRVEASDDEEAH